MARSCTYTTGVNMLTRLMYRCLVAVGYRGRTRLHVPCVQIATPDQARIIVWLHAWQGKWAIFSLGSQWPTCNKFALAALTHWWGNQPTGTAKVMTAPEMSFELLAPIQTLTLDLIRSIQKEKKQAKNMKTKSIRSKLPDQSSIRLRVDDQWCLSACKCGPGETELCWLCLPLQPALSGNEAFKQP